MNKEKRLRVLVPTFVNPTLFWIIDTCKVFDREELEEELQKDELETTDPIVGEFVAVKDDLRIKRAKVLEIDVTLIKGKYKCWLIDYGIIFYTNSVYNLEMKYKSIPAFALRASLLEVVYLQTVLEIDDNKLNFVETTEAVQGARTKALQYIKESNDIYFTICEEKYSISFGDLIVSIDGKHFSLTKELIKNQVLTKNKELFWKNIEESGLHSDITSIIRDVSRNSLCSDSSSIRYDSRARTYVIDVPVKNLIDEVQSEETGRSCKLRSVKSTPSSSVLNDFLQNQSNFKNNKSSQDKKGNYSEVSVQNSKQSAKTPNTCNVLNKLKRFKDKSEKEIANVNETVLSSSSVLINESTSESENLNQNTNVDKYKNFFFKNSSTSCAIMDNNENRLKITQCETKKQTLNNKGLHTGENMEQVSNSNKNLFKFEATDSLSDDSNMSHLNFYPAEYQMRPKKSSKTKKFNTSSKVTFKKSHSTIPCNSKASSHIKANMSTLSSNTSTSTDNKNCLIQNTVTNEQVYSSSPSSIEDDILNIEDNGKKKLTGCFCDKCKFWDMATLGNDYIEKFADTKIKTVKDFTRPPLLLKTETKDQIEIKTLAMLSSSLASKEKVFHLPPLVVHGPVIPSPTMMVQDVPFHENVHHCLSKNGFKQARKIQMYVWPAIMRNMNVCYVNSGNSGKTMAYLPAIYSFLLEEDRYHCFSPKMGGPLAVIVCEGNKKAEQVYGMVLKMKATMKGRDTCDAILALLPFPPTVTKLLSKKHSLLVTTLPSLVILLQLRQLSLKRMCHLIFENVDIFIKNHSHHFNSLLRFSQEILQHRTCSLPIQLILSAERWTNHLCEIVRQLESPPLICIGAYLEAAIYGKANIKVHFMESKLKQSTLVEVLTNNNNYYNKCIVICNTDEELEEASYLFPNRSIKSLIIKSSLIQTEIKAREHQWNSSPQGAYPVLLCTDEVFNNSLNVTDATLLVHYSLPASWTFFSQRFSCFVDNYTSPFGLNNVNDIICKSFIFVDEKCELQFPRLMAFLQRMNTPLIDRFVKRCQMLKEQEEIKKIHEGIKLCKTLKILGSCADEKCKNRHLLSNEMDFSRNVDGYVKFEILSVQDVSTYVVKIIEFIKDGIKNCTDVEDIERRLRETLDDKMENAEEIISGNWFAALDTDRKTFKRCEVVKVLNNGGVRIFYLDGGLKDTVPKNRLYKLPEEFKKILPQAILVHFANMVPPENDSHFASHSVQVVEHILRNAEDKFDSKTYKGRIRLFLKGDTLWLDNIVLTHSLKNSDVTVLYLKDKLLKNKLANYKDTALDGLFELCRNVDIPVPKYEVQQNDIRIKKDDIQPRYAFLEEDVSYNEVYFRTGNSPSEFFVSLKKFYELVEKLEKDVTKKANNQAYKLEGKVTPGDYCLAFDDVDKKFCRARVISINNDYAECFFVDYGDIQFVKFENLRNLPEKFILRLPFQAIECRLYGISPVLDVWCKEATDMLYDYCYEPASDCFRTLYAVVHSKEAAQFSGDKKYSISLLDNLNGRTISIGSLMIDCGFAGFVEGEKLPEDLPVIKNNTFSSSDCDVDDHHEEPTENIHTDEFEDELDTDEWDLRVFNVSNLINGKYIDVERVLQRNSNNREMSIPPNGVPFNEYRTPTVVWHQTDIHIKLDIQVPHVTDYIVKVLRDRVFVFKTDQNGVPYHLTIQLYDKVEKTFVHSAGGLVVKVTLSKCRKEEWPRLSINKSMKNIKYNMEMHQEAQEEVCDQKFLTIRNKELNEPIQDEEEPITFIGSDFDENSDSDIFSSD